MPHAVLIRPYDVVLSPPRPRFIGCIASLIGFPEGLSGRDDTDGKTSPPCEKQIRRGIIRGIIWPVDPGNNTFSIWVKHSGHTPAPRIIVKANPQVGLQSDLVVQAGPSTDWQQLTVQFTATDKGAVEVWREVRAIEQNAFAKWDDIAVG